MWKVYEDRLGWAVSVGMGVLVGVLALLSRSCTAEAGPFAGETSTYARESGFESKFYYGSSGGALDQIEYICRAFPGTTGSDATSSSVWQVQRFTYNSSGQITDIEFAGDNDAFDQVCDNRASLNYD